jgi:hypothetical protein
MARTAPILRIRPGDRLDATSITAIDGSPIAIPPESGILHLQLRRFAGCPVCNLHLRSIVRRHDELVAAGVREVAVFHSTADELRPHVDEIPFEVVADPDKHLYRRYGAETSIRAFLDPRAWPVVVRALASSVWAIVRGRGRPPKLFPDGGRYGLPAELLVDTNGVVLASHYGRHVGDHWSVDDVLELVARAPSSSSRASRQPR